METPGGHDCSSLSLFMSSPFDFEFDFGVDSFHPVFFLFFRGGVKSCCLLGCGSARSAYQSYPTCAYVHLTLSALVFFRGIVSAIYSTTMLCYSSDARADYCFCCFISLPGGNISLQSILEPALRSQPVLCVCVRSSH